MDEYIERLKMLLTEATESADAVCYVTADDAEVLKAAIKALEQESVLNELRAEIENHCGLAKENHCKYCSYCNSVMGVREILEVIDKYKVESEG